MRKDGVQRLLCRDCKKSFIPSSCSIALGTRENLSVWAQYLKCMSDRKTLKETVEECSISVTTAFYWRHKILDALQELTDITTIYRQSHRFHSSPRDKGYVT